MMTLKSDWTCLEIPVTVLFILTENMINTVLSTYDCCIFLGTDVINQGHELHNESPSLY